MEKVIEEIQDLKNVMVHYRKMLRCVDKNERIYVDVKGIDSCVDDIEGECYHPVICLMVAVGESKGKPFQTNI